MRHHFVPVTNTKMGFCPLKCIVYIQMKMNVQLGNSFIDALKCQENGQVP